MKQQAESKTKKLIYILISSIIVITVLAYTDAVVKLPYLVRSPLKITIFLVVPIIYSRYSKVNIIKRSIDNYRNTNIETNLFLGVLVIAVIMLTYYLVASFIDISKIKDDVQSKYLISKSTYIFMALYLSFVNSFLEELFFRGYLFLNIKQLGYCYWGYIISSFLFAIYHVSNINGWFGGFTFALALFGLFVGGVIFSFLDDKRNTFLNSYIIHICADLAIVIIGYTILY